MEKRWKRWYPATSDHMFGQAIPYLCREYEFLIRIGFIHHLVGFLLWICFLSGGGFSNVNIGLKTQEKVKRWRPATIWISTIMQMYFKLSGQVRIKKAACIEPRTYRSGVCIPLCWNGMKVGYSLCFYWAFLSTVGDWITSSEDSKESFVIQWDPWDLQRNVFGLIQMHWHCPQVSRNPTSVISCNSW